MHRSAILTDAHDILAPARKSGPSRTGVFRYGNPWLGHTKLLAEDAIEDIPVLSVLGRHLNERPFGLFVLVKADVSVSVPWHKREHEAEFSIPCFIVVTHDPEADACRAKLIYKERNDFMNRPCTLVNPRFGQKGARQDGQ